MMMKRCGTTKAARRTAASPALAPAASVVPAVSSSGRCQLRPAIEEKQRQRASALVLPRRVSSGSRSGTTAHVFGLFGGGNDDEDYDEAYTVAKIQVAMFGNVRKYQQQLELLSEMYDTDDEESLHTVMRETVKFLLRNLSHVGYAQTAGKIFDNMDDCEAKFNSVSLEESAKFKEETYSNVDGEKQRKVFQGQGADVGLDEWLAVTVLVAVERKLKLPKISTQQDLKTALTDTAGCPAEELLAFELLWTPQAEGDSYSKDDLLVDYPTLALL